MALPDGRLQTVSYTVDGDTGGFSANVHYTGKARHPHQNESPGSVTIPVPIHPHQGSVPSNPHQDKSQVSLTRTYNKLSPGQSSISDSEKSVRYVPHKSFQQK